MKLSSETMADTRKSSDRLQERLEGWHDEISVSRVH